MFAHRAAGLVEHAAGDDDALAERLAVPRAVLRQVVVERADALVAEDRPGQLRQRVLQRDQRPLRPAQHRGFVARIDIGRMRAPVARRDRFGRHPRGMAARHATSLVPVQPARQLLLLRQRADDAVREEHQHQHHDQAGAEDVDLARAERTRRRTR